MSVAKVTEIISESSKSFDDAVENGIKRASKTFFVNVSSDPNRGMSSSGSSLHPAVGSSFIDLVMINRSGTVFPLALLPVLLL